MRFLHLHLLHQGHLESTPDFPLLWIYPLYLQKIQLYASYSLNSI